MSQKVYVVKCPDYEQVADKMEELLAMMGGISAFVKAEERILLKPNLLTAVVPEKAVTTHPAIVKAFATLAKHEGAWLTIADSPGSGLVYNEKTMRKVYRETGMAEVAEITGIEASLETGHDVVSFPEGKLIKRFEVIEPVLRADAVINLCKLKTHGFLFMTGAVKNSFGVIPGLTKPGYHAKLHEPERFASMCLDLSNYVAPRLSIMDAVIGMEGNGPHAGTPKQVGVLLASENPLALDVVAAEIMGLKQENNPVLLEAEKRGQSPNRIEDVELVGLDKAELRIADFKLPSTLLTSTGSVLLAKLAPLLKHGLTVRPKIREEKCVACGACRDSCPVHVISIEKKCAKISHKDCIRCYCCHEMCAYNAIELQGGVLYRLFHRK